MPPPIIDDTNWLHFVSPVIDGEIKSHGLIPRNYSTHPQGYQASASAFPDELLIPQSEQQGRLDLQVSTGTSLFDLRAANYDLLKSLDQNGRGYCWAFSTTKSVMYARCVDNEPPVRLSAWMVACIIKNYRDEGGWGAESLDFWAKTGGASLDEWPQGGVSPKYDTPAMRAAAAQRKVTEWWDGSDDRNQNVQIMISAFLMGFAPVLDFNWWSHSVCGCRLVSLNPLTIDIDNSWGESAGDKGIFRLTGNKAIPDGVVVPRVATPSP